jgi:hypothetical protein
MFITEGWQRWFFILNTIKHTLSVINEGAKDGKRIDVRRKDVTLFRLVLVRIVIVHIMKLAKIEALFLTAGAQLAMSIQRN